MVYGSESTGTTRSHPDGTRQKRDLYRNDSEQKKEGEDSGVLMLGGWGKRKVLGKKKECPPNNQVPVNKRGGRGGVQSKEEKKKKKKKKEEVCRRLSQE